MKTIVFAGGGTGGHVFPIKTLIEYILNDKEINGQIKEIYWVGNADGLEYQIFQKFKSEKIKFLNISSGKLRRDLSFGSIVANISDFFRFLKGLIQSLSFLKNNSINVIFCKGGYAALPLVIAGKIKKSNIIVHESDSIPGLVNKIASKFSKVNFCGFPRVLNNCKHVGQIISNELFDYDKNEFDLAKFQMKKTNILVFAGSQGSKFIFETLLDLFENDKLFYSNFNFIVILGKLNEKFQRMFNKYKFVKSIKFATQKQIGFLCDYCDIGITRGGATSLAEQKLFGMKLLIIPLPYTGGNHQYFNGQFYHEKFGDILIDQNFETGSKLQHELFQLRGFKKSKQKIGDISLAKFEIVSKLLEF